MADMFLPGNQFPPGFRFHPTDQELLVHYLQKKINTSLPPASSIIAEIDLYKFNPWDLPAKAFFGEGEWFFFSPRDRKYPNGVRPNRAAGYGYWKATGTDKPILAAGGSQCLGVKKALVFHKGRPPKGVKTEWIMHEYRLLDTHGAGTHKQLGSMRLDDWVLCRVRQKGCFPSVSDEDHENSKSGCSSAIHKNVVNQAPTMASQRRNLFEEANYQFLGYMLASQEEEENDYKSSGMGFAQIYDMEKDYLPAVVNAQPLHPALDSIKRKLSFGALDEFLLLEPNKRFKNSNSNDELSSITS